MWTSGIRNAEVRRTPMRRGMTLTEVIAGLVLLTTVLAAVFIARGRFLAQWADADRKLAASRAVDSLIGQWLAAPPDRVPVNNDGVLGGVEGCRWSTRRVLQPAATRLGAKVIRLEVTRNPEPGMPRSDRLVLAVEFLLPEDPKSTTSRLEAN